MVEPAPTSGGSPPNPAGPEGRSAEPLGESLEMSRPARHMVALADRLPDWLGSVRFRLTAIYSIVLFALAAFMVAGMYAVLAARLHEEHVYRSYRVTTVQEVPGGFELTPTEVRSEYRSVEQLANERALSLLRTYSAAGLALLFLASLGVGWLVAGRVLAPIGRITQVARDIQATDLSRRIALRGPPDELKELADTFDAMLSRLDDAFDGQRRFIQEASHELRNPLAVMRTNLDVALADPDPDPDEMRHTIDVVNRSAGRLSRLVDDLLVYGRQGAPAHERVPVDLGELCVDAAAEFQVPAQARSLTLAVNSGSTTGDPGAGLAVAWGDRLALGQILTNLLANAVRLAPEGSTITVAVPSAPGWAGLQVADEGPGIPADQRDLVFQRFWRGDTSTARAEGRSGLGLAIVDQIVRDHGGHVDLQPSPSGGSVFTVWLPAAPLRPSPAA